MSEQLIREQILLKLLEQHLLESKPEMVIGIAKQATTRGYNSLTEKQIDVLENNDVFNHICDGDIVHQECRNTLSDEELLAALNETWHEYISCSSCLEMIDSQNYTWSRMSRE